MSRRTGNGVRTTQRVHTAPGPVDAVTNTWRDAAACLGQPADLWFPDEAAVGSTNTSTPISRHWRKDNADTATAICDTCPVRAECLTTHRNESYGIFGGLHYEERRAWTRLHELGKPFIHGDEAGAKRHRRNGEEVCPACLKGARLAQAERTWQARQANASLRNGQNQAKAS